MSHSAELAKYGTIQYGFSTSMSLAVVGGGTVEFGYVVTDKNYAQYYSTVSYTHGFVPPSSSGNIFFISPSNSGYQPTFSDWHGGTASGNVGWFALGIGEYTGGTYNSTTFSLGIGKIPKFLNFFNDLRSVSSSVSVGSTELRGNPIYMQKSPKDYFYDYLNMYK